MRLETHHHITRLAHHHNTRLDTSSQHMRLEIFMASQHKAGTSTLLPLSREVLSDYTKLISKVLKLYMR
jgi:hypothetical protein